MVDFAKSLNLEVTFHRAFDLVKDYKSAINKIIAFNFDRLLTSGLKNRAIEGINVIRFLQTTYGDKIQIMAGSGIDATNAKEISKTGVQHLHFTARKIKNNTSDLSLGINTCVDEDKILNILNSF